MKSLVFVPHILGNHVQKGKNALDKLQQSRREEAIFLFKIFGRCTLLILLSSELLRNERAGRVALISQLLPLMPSKHTSDQTRLLRQ